MVHFVDSLMVLSKRKIRIGLRRAGRNGRIVAVNEKGTDRVFGDGLWWSGAGL